MKYNSFLFQLLVLKYCWFKKTERVYSNSVSVEYIVGVCMWLSAEIYILADSPFMAST